MLSKAMAHDSIETSGGPQRQSAPGDGGLSAEQAEYVAEYPHLTPTDLAILALPDDAAFTRHSWANLGQLIASNELHLLARSPSQLRAYLGWSTRTRARYGGLTNYLLRRRLRWTPLPAADDDAAARPRFECKDATPFAHPDDHLVLRNDWPYGLDPGIAHVCVWLKTPLAVEPGDGDLTDQARALVDRFVTQTFREPLGEVTKGEKVMWFKNWTKLQSVRGIDHVHVLVRDAPEQLLQRWMG